jgi:uncharacterized protein
LEALIQEVKKHVHAIFSSTEGSHDWYHVERVWKMAIFLHAAEGGNRIVIELAALLHDISDHKYNGGSYDKGAIETKELLLSFGASPLLAEEVALIVSHVSYKGALVPDFKGSLELAIVRDSDRLDAIGAIGIARAFAYGGSKNRALFAPETRPVLHQSKEEYLVNQGHTINHFYEKLFLLKDRMETNKAKEIAKERHEVMLNFVDQFMAEWDINSEITN